MSDRSVSVSPSLFLSSVSAKPVVPLTAAQTKLLLAAALTLGIVAPAAGEPLCRPALTVEGITFSNIHQWRRTWAAHIAVDASRCATTSGRFAIHCDARYMAGGHYAWKSSKGAVRLFT